MILKATIATADCPREETFSVEASAQASLFGKFGRTGTSDVNFFE